MKTASSALQAYLGANQNLIFADLWSFVLKNGISLYYAQWDFNLMVGGQNYVCNDVLITGGKFKQVRGLEVNETDVTCYPSLGTVTPASMVGGLPFLQAVRLGLFDRAVATRMRLFMPTPGNVSLGAVTLFIGEVTDTDATRNTATLKCKDATNLLNIYMPRRQYQPTCSWTFGDSNCTVNKAALTVNSTVGAGSGGNIILASLHQVAGFFNYGTVTFTSGKNQGISRSVKTYSPGSVTLTGPFPSQAAVGDTFSICPGCSKNYTGTTQSFNGAAESGLSPSFIGNNLGNPAGAFNGYTMQFTSGALSGKSGIISVWSPNSATMVTPFNQAPTGGDFLEILPPGGGAAVAFGQASPLLTSTVIPIGLPMPDGFFTGGTIQFTSGANVGAIETITSWSQQTAVLPVPLANPPAVGDGCTLTTAAANTQNTCTGYNNTINFAGMDQIPIPETAY